jgi:hypothetical protein
MIEELSSKYISSLFSKENSELSAKELRDKHYYVTYQDCKVTLSELGILFWLSVNDLFELAG